MRCLVTGAAGFIGSHLCEALLADGHDVTGLDAFIPYYPRAVKEQNLAGVRANSRFRFVECDLRKDNLAPVVDGVEVIFHLAAMGGLLASWTNFDEYMTCNIQAPYRLLAAAKASSSVREFIHASTSSIYGSYVTGPETALPRPVSPYGITKLAAENLVQTFQQQYGLPATILRYFSVYGPRQRPDMGYYLFIDGILRGQTLTIFGDGSQLRSNTYVTDIVNGTILAHRCFQPGETYNLGGAEEVSVMQVITLLEDLIGKKANLQFGPKRPGEQDRALADVSKAREALGFSPSTPLIDGLRAQVAWQRQLVQ